MILRVTLKNILSFNEETSINLTAGKTEKDHPSHVSFYKDATELDGIPVLKLGLIYGANASGKSNIFKAVSIVQQIALGGFPSRDIEPFKLGKQIKPISKVEIEFKTTGKYYAYGVEFSRVGGIHQEWLYEFDRNDRNTDRKIFSREEIKASSATANCPREGHKFEFGQIEGDEQGRQFVRFLGKGTPTKKSFLSEFVERNGLGLNGIKETYNWFAKGLRIIFPNTRYRGIWYNTPLDEANHKACRELLKYFGTGIADIKRIPIPSIGLTYLPQRVIETILGRLTLGRTAMVADQGTNEYYLFEFNQEHATYSVSKLKPVLESAHNEEVVFEMRQLSEGTLRILDFIPMLIDFRECEVDYLIDDLGRSLHPVLCKKLIEYFLHCLSQERDTQLLASAHETNLLDLEMIRRDEVWFVEKGRDNGSKLFSLAEFKPRENIQKGYLLGRYGAVPVFPPIETLSKQSTCDSSRKDGEI